MAQKPDSAGGDLGKMEAIGRLALSAIRFRVLGERSLAELQTATAKRTAHAAFPGREELCVVFCKATLMAAPASPVSNAYSAKIRVVTKEELSHHSTKQDCLIVRSIRVECLSCLFE